MNKQKKIPDYVRRILRDNGIDENAKYYAWPHMFGDTSGPRCGGLAGQICTVFTVEAYHSFADGKTLYICDGMMAISKRKFEPFVAKVHFFDIPDKYTGGETTRCLDCESFNRCTGCGVSGQSVPDTYNHGCRGASGDVERVGNEKNII